MQNFTWKILRVFFLTFFAALVLSACGAKKKSSAHVSRPVSMVDRKHDKGRADVRQYYADLLAANPKELNVNLYEFIDEWMGSPHRLGGQSKNGVDCSGFVNMIYLQVYQKTLPRTSRDMGEIVKRKYDNQLKEGDLVFFSFGGKNIDHVGIYLHNDKFVHVSTKQGVVISNLKDTWYYKYFTRCGTPQI